MLVQDDPHASIKLVSQKLVKRGYNHEEYNLCGKSYWKFSGPKEQRWITNDAIISYPFPTSSAARISKNKDLAYELARKLHISVPFTLEVDTKKKSSIDAEALLEKYSKLIVKPYDATLSRGLTLDISTPDELEDAINIASKHSSKVLVQEQVFGEEIRFAVIDGRVEAALLRRTPRVTGDGLSTVKQLIEIENEKRAELEMPYLKYPLLDERIIDKSFLSDLRVLSKGEILELGRGSMIATGASVYNILEDIHPSYLGIVRKLGNSIGKGFVVVDVIVADYKQPSSDNNYWFLEFNMSPMLKMFYSCRDNRHFDAADRLADLIDNTLSR